MVNYKLTSMKTPTTVLCQYEDGDGGDFNAVECKMAVEYRDKIESGEIKEREIGQE